MIIFYTDSGVELNLTNLGITFVEENALFYDAFFKNYTLPFLFPITDEISTKLGLIDIDNISNYTVKYPGKLLIHNQFELGYLLLEEEDEHIEATIYFGKTILPVLETSLKSLPFPVIVNTSINTYAKNAISKAWPDVPCNFPMVYDAEFKNQSNYDAFEGFLNNYEASNFKTNSIESGTGKVLNKNVMVPFPYLIEILKTGFGAAGMKMIGDFVNKKENQYILLDPKKHLEQFSTATFENYQFKTPTDIYILNGELVYEYKKEHIINAVGSYSVKCFMNFPKDIEVVSFEVLKNGTPIFSTNANAIDESVTINYETTGASVNVKVLLKIKPTEIDLTRYNNFVYEKSEGKLNIFKNTFSLAEFMPDITFGKFLGIIKNWLNLKVTLRSNYVVIDYTEKKFMEVSYKDEKAFEVKNPKRKFNQAKLYKLTYDDGSELLVDKNGRCYSTESYREEDIISIETPISIMHVETRGTVFTAARYDDAKFSLLLYNGLDANGYPVAASSIFGYTFKLPEVFNLYWKKWLHFRLNSETYTDRFTAHALEPFNINEGRFKYNKKHIYKTIKKKCVDEENWEIEIESETL